MPDTKIDIAEQARKDLVNQGNLGWWVEQYALPLLDQLEQSQREVETAQSERALYARTLERFRNTVLFVTDKAEDEGDRVYFGSTNHFHSLKDVAQKMDDLNWDAILAHTQPPVDLYARVAELTADVEQLKGARPAEVSTLVKLLRENEPDHQPDDGDTDMTITVDEARRISWALLGVPVPWPWRDAMDTAWRAVDALGGVGAHEEYSRALTEACAAIDKLGGRDPDPVLYHLRSQQSADQARIARLRGALAQIDAAGSPAHNDGLAQIMADTARQALQEGE